MRLVCFSLLLTFYAALSTAQQVPKINIPDWVKKVSVPEAGLTENAGNFSYLLIDKQVNLAENVTFWQTAYQLHTADGIQQMSDLTFDFDPSYQTAEVHEVRIIRGGQSIDLLPELKINTYQRETGMDRALYDGSLTAVINLKDVRKDDVVIYSYSVKGSNPILHGHYYSVFYQQFSVSVEQIHHRILVPEQKVLTLKLFNEAVEPATSIKAGVKEYTWSMKSVKALLYDSNVPGWYDPAPRVAVSSVSSWEEVVDWAVPLFNYPESDKVQLEDLSSSYNEFQNKELTIIRMVQDEIRYLGFESGIGAYKPHSPAQVAAQRYGDCKDKSLLMVALLRNEGIEAYPVLVNTVSKDEMRHVLPGMQAFDHCIVTFKKDGQSYFVDPTISNQGGDLDRMSVPSYGYGLIIKPGETELTKFDQAVLPTVYVNELITVTKIGEPVDMIVRTEYTGEKADFIRAYFSGGSQESIQNDYASYYRNLYPSIVSTEPVRFYDYDRYSSNKVITEEYYSVPDFWQNTEDSVQVFAEIYPLLLSSNLNLPQTIDRSMPYWLGTPYSYRQLTRIDLPEPWYIGKIDQKIFGEGFGYTSSMSGSGNSVEVNYTYDLRKSFVSGEEAQDVLAKHGQIEDDLLMYLLKELPSTGTAGNWATAFLFIIGFSLSIFIAIRVYRRYNPEPYEFAMNKPIGSWLILPAIGVCLSPFMLGTDIYSIFLTESFWLQSSVGLNVLIGVEILVNIAMFTLSILVLVLFFQRRSSLPRIISIAYLIYFLIPLLDLLAVNLILPDQGMADGTLKIIVRNFIAALVWIPIFNLSEKVKNTFCLQYGQRHVKKSRYMSERLQQPLTVGSVETTPGDHSSEHRGTSLE
jgi:hypothetical protein